MSDGDEAEGCARDALAERLNALREGSGRTYASLARRVGVSGSTLHRYCTGRTVPAEFAAVERLARLCGAPGGEREALHRLWLLADAERLDRQGAGDAAAEPVRETPGAGPNIGGETDAARETPGAEPTAGGEAEAVRKTPGAGLVRAGEPGTVAKAARESSAPGPGDGEGPRPGASYGAEGRALPAAPGRSRRVRRYGQAVAALAAAVVVLALVTGFGGTRLPFLPGQDRLPSAAQGPGIPPGVVPEPSATDGTPAPGTPSGAPSRGPRSTAPPGVARQEGVPGPPGPSTEPDPDPGTGAGRVPFTWTSDDQVWKSGCGHSYLVDRAPAAVPPPPVEADGAAWAKALGAVHAGDTGVRITVQGRDERAVVLEALRIRVVERGAPVGGRVYRMSPGCGGALTPRVFDVDLDVPRPVARSVPGNDSGVPIEAVAFPYRVSASDPEVFLVTGRTVRCDCYWFAELVWSSGGRSGAVRIDDDGRPFRTSGARGRPVHDYDTDTGRWVTREEADEAEEPSS
ncbi:helix-turn-helix domain-containing protein [Streptomyces sp. C11-1]|uniref:Helix-turn-helix domain-containing protein n=1 Tax=Streptomyces durocortorensis TaxID=2811104 RepID=A0ABY9W424_9ACTN|nr:helix-turn-helix domain-containing protein [Streptomyces durocortorensis]WNF30897.1 helix-turn-helix domain-containing protein [Streptomyces durocortorensis]